jgi:CHAT domain-containing protein
VALAEPQAPGLPVLSHAEQEARTVAGLFNTQALVGAAATESALAARVPQAGLLHLAAHGQLNQLSPLFSRIVLAPDEKNDGNLEVHELYGLDLAQTDLVVLSACNTQLGSQSLGDDLVGLTRAFMYAGAPSVVASLWSVDDEATELLMRAFYTKLQQGRGKAQALREAQQDLRQQLPHPYYWAAFVLTGDPGPYLPPAPPPTPTVALAPTQPPPPAAAAAGATDSSGLIPATYLPIAILALIGLAALGALIIVKSRSGSRRT